MTALIDYEALDAYLMSDSSPDECMMLSDMDGFLHGLACGPSRVPSDEWLGVAFGTDATSLAGWVVEAVETRSAQILSNLQREAPVVEPVFWQAPEGHLIAMDWCEGFMQAVALRPQDWLRLTESGTSGHLLQPIMTHILDENGNSVLGILQEDLDVALDDAAARIPDAVVKIFFVLAEPTHRGALTRQIRRHGGVGSRPAEGAGRREHQAQAPAGRYDARQRGPERSFGKELTTLSKRREAVLRAMRDHDISQRRACRLVGVDPKTVRRERPPDCPEIRKEMQEIAGKRRRFGYRRIGVLLERKGMIMNHKKLYRLYREEGLSLKRRRGRKRARGTRTPMPEAARPNARWSLDFLSDSFGASRKFRILAVIDDCCRENLCLMADTSISGSRVA